MGKTNRQYICQRCGTVAPKWTGQCPDCGQWNTLVEGITGCSKSAANGHRLSPVTRLESIEIQEINRTSCGLAEMDRVLGGGIVPGAAILIGGDPGIGKSTLLLQLLASIEGRVNTLYVTGEESLAQVAIRARRLGLAQPNLPALAETNLEAVMATLDAIRPGLVVLDSVQTLYTDTLDSAPGSISQLRECAASLVRYAKSSGCAVILVGHVTKEGAIAGPRVLEHMVDTVLYFEHDSGSRFRVVRAVKNRFGAVNEVGVFAMMENGLREVSNPSALFLSQHTQAVSGSVVTVVRQGTRPLVVEVQVLVDLDGTANPRRLALGLESNRLSMLLAVLHRHAGVGLGAHDVFANVVGGLRIQETAADLPVLLAALSSFRGRPVDRGLIAFGEIGLAGEIRPVVGGEERLVEAAKHGFKKVLIPASNKPRLNRWKNIQVVAVSRLDEAIQAV